MLLQHLISEIDIERHLKDRGVDLERTKVIYDKESNLAHFILYNLSGQLVGYQRYDPSQGKSRNNLGRYFTHITKYGKDTLTAVYGLESIKKSTKYLFVVEGIFDCIKVHNTGNAAIAVLRDNPKNIKQWLKLLPYKIIVIADRDAAGNRLKKFGDKAYTVPENYKDLGDMPQSEVNDFIRGIVK